MADSWDQVKIEKMISDQVEESHRLDYKRKESLGRTESKIKELSKDISSMANSDGGVVIYGVKEYDDEEKRHLPERVDPINRQGFSKEWLDQVINANIQPRIEGINIHPIAWDGELNGVLYVVEIPQSTTAHQARDKRYHRRYNFEILSMMDYEIRDIMARAKNPKIELSFSVNSAYFDGPRLFVLAENTGPVYAHYVKCIILVPARCLNDPKAQSVGQLLDVEGQKYWEVYADNRQRDILSQGYSINRSGISELTTTEGPSWFDPILPGNIMLLRHLVLANDFVDYKNAGGFSIKWTVYADNALPNSKITPLADIPQEMTIYH